LCNVLELCGGEREREIEKFILAMDYSRRRRENLSPEKRVDSLSLSLFSHSGDHPFDKRFHPKSFSMINLHYDAAAALSPHKNLFSSLSSCVAASE
jgi:hypothetical protein